MMTHLGTFYRTFLGGGGKNRFFLIAILTFLLMLSNLRAIELNQICQNGSYTNCSIDTIYGEVTNSGFFSFRGNNNSSILLNTNGGIDTFINYGTITSENDYSNTFYWSFGYISNVINYGTMGGLGGSRGGAGQYMPVSVTNYGKMKGVGTGWGNADITINNYGVIDMLSIDANWHHFSGNGNYNFVLKNYAMVIQQDSDTFNTFTGGRPDYGDNSHLIIKGGNIKFQDFNSKIILDFGNNFEFGKEYSLDRLVMNDNYWATWTTRLPVEFYRLTTRSELYTLTQSGNNFIVNPADSKTAGYSTIGLLHKSNVKTMNSLYLQSNNTIYPQRHTKRKRTLQRRVIRKRVANVVDDASLREIVPTRHSEPLGEESMNLSNGVNSNVLDSFALDSSLISFAQNDRFFYKSDSNYYANNATTNQRANNQTRRRITTTNRTSSNQTTQNNNYYFMLTPFVAHNYFFESGRYNLSGLEYGFITAFGGNISPSNYLGAHFAFSYGSLSDKNDKIFNITSSNMMVGLHYKFNMIWSMYLKARIDAFYFLNQVQSIAVTSGRVIKPNNLGFGASVAYGKEWDFGNGGVLGVEVALDYKGLISPNILTQNGGDANINESFSKAFYNMLYVDLGLNYDKYFETSVGKWGLDAGLGAKINATANALAKSNIRLNNIRDINMMLDNDMVLAYLNVGGSYVLNAKNFDMEFSVAYYGNYGDRTMSNGGGVEWRVVW